MTPDLRRQTLHRAVAEIIAFETELAARLELEKQAACGYPEAAAVIESLVPMVQTQRDRLVAYVESLVSDPGPSTTSAGFAFAPTATLSSALRQVSDALSHGAASYAMLFEMALLLYEPPLREIAPEHLEAYAEAATLIDGLLPATVAWELAQDNLQCSCICPMCGLGACGCVAFGTQTLMRSWREAPVAEASSPGLALEVPRPDSQLARAGVGGGDRLLAVEGREVRSRSELQAAIRRHALGDELRLLVQRGSDLPREVACKHVSDYPET